MSLFACDVGDLVRIESWDDVNLGFAIADGTLTDPTTVTLRLQKPDGTTTDYTYAGGGVTRLSAGKFYKDVLVDQARDWRFRWIGTGTVQAASQGQFFARVPVPA